MKYLCCLAFLLGCVTTEQDEVAERPVESEWVAAVTTCKTGSTGTWCTEDAPAGVTGVLHAVWAASATDVFAAGDGGTILRRVNGTWTTMTSGTTTDLRGLFGSSSSDVWAGGNAGVLVHFNGTAWSTVSGPTTDIDAVWASSTSNAWFVGSSTVLHWTGSQFISSSLTGQLLAVSGTGSSDVYVTGEDANVRHWNGSAWSTMNPGAGTTYLSVLAIAVNSAWVSDFMPSKQTVRWNGSTWSPFSTGGANFNGMSALSSSDIWGAGGTRIGHWNGTAWTVDSTSFPSASLWSVTTRPGHAWVVGNSGFIAHHTF
jgi:hypothetical protein